VLCLLHFSLLLKIEFLSTLLLGKIGLFFAFFARERWLMALPTLGVPLGTVFFKDMLAR